MSVITKQVLAILLALRSYMFVSYEEAGPRDRSGQPVWLGNTDTGGYSYPVLNYFGSHKVEVFNIPEDQEGFQALSRYMQQDKVLTAYTNGGRVTVIRSGYTLEDMGIHTAIPMTGAAGKFVKRLNGIIARPFRAYTHLNRPLRVLVLDESPLRDGGFVVHPDLVREANGNIDLPGFHPVQREQLIRSYDEAKRFSVRGIGDMVDTNGKPINAVLKGHGFVGRRDVFPEGVDVITSTDNLKSELWMTGHGFFYMQEPMTTKGAWEDQQTIANSPWLLSVPEARTRMNEALNDFYEDLSNGRVNQSIRDLSKREFSTRYGQDGVGFGKLLRWNVYKMALYGLDYRTSPWLTERIGLSETIQYQVDNHKKLRIPIKGAVRTQCISAELARMCGYNVDVDDGEITWVEELDCTVVSNTTWLDEMIETHGGCDMDDDFVHRVSIDKDGNPTAILTRSPHSRGAESELRVWSYWPGAKDGRPITKKRRATPILEALATGETSYVPLPSEGHIKEDVGTRPYTIEDAINSLKEEMEISGAYGSFELAQRAFNSTHPTRHIERTIKPEDAVDSFTQGGSAEDREFVGNFTDEIYTQIIGSGKPVDAVLHGRMPKEMRNIVRKDPKGIISTMKRVQMETVEDYTKKVRAYTQTLEIPAWLEQIGNNETLELATKLLIDARRAMGKMNDLGIEQQVGLTEGIQVVTTFVSRETPAGHTRWVKFGHRVFFGNDVVTEEDLAVEDDTEKKEITYTWVGFNSRFADMAPHRRAQFIMALWYAQLTVPTRSTGRISDQMFFGNDQMLSHLLDTLVYWGVAAEPTLTEEGTVERHNNVVWANGTWNISCKVCGIPRTNVGEAFVQGYHANDGVCSNCRS